MYYLKDSDGNAVEQTIPLNESLKEHFEGFVSLDSRKATARRLALAGFKDVTCIDAWHLKSLLTVDR